MRKVLLYSVLLILGLAASQALPGLIGPGYRHAAEPVKLLTMFCLAFIMIHVGYEFEIDKADLRRYGWDFVVAATAASLPWVFCTLYFVFVMSPRGAWGAGEAWKRALLEGVFASPTSAGVLFSMLAAAGLSATWVFRKARVLAIFDDLDVLLLLIPLQMMLAGFKPALLGVLVLAAGLLGIAWRDLHRRAWPVSWPWVLLYAGLVVLACEALLLASRRLGPGAEVHFEVLLPAFALGCVLARPPGSDPHLDDRMEGIEPGPEAPATEQKVATAVSACFMVLVGLSMPAVLGGRTDGGSTEAAHPAAAAGWGTLALHVLAITFLCNLGKMFPALCYRREAAGRERLALAVGMWPRGEVGAGVLVIAASYGLGGDTLTVAVLSLALNLVGTGFFILVVKKLLAGPTRRGGPAAPAAP